MLAFTTPYIFLWTFWLSCYGFRRWSLLASSLSFPIQPHSYLRVSPRRCWKEASGLPRANTPCPTAFPFISAFVLSSSVAGSEEETFPVPPWSPSSDLCSKFCDIWAEKPYSCITPFLSSTSCSCRFQSALCVFPPSTNVCVSALCSAF